MIDATKHPAMIPIFEALKGCMDPLPDGSAGFYVSAFTDHEVVLLEFGIDVDSWENGVYLPTRNAANLKGSTLHRATQRPRAQDYSAWVSKQLERAQSKEQALKILDTIRNDVLSGRDPW